MPQAGSADTTNVLQLSTYRKANAVRPEAPAEELTFTRREADADVDSNTSLILLMAICTALHSGNDRDRMIYMNVRWSLAKLKERMGDGRSLQDAFFILNSIEEAAAR
jgi:hypothetical protein